MLPMFDQTDHYFESQLETVGESHSSSDVGVPPSVPNAWELLPHLQSAYRANHSTQTTVLKVLHNILQAVNISISALARLDLPAPFVTADHDILLQMLQTAFCI